MSDSSRRSRVTVTLGRNGRVVKRAGVLLDEVGNGLPTAGSKRSIRDRLGGSSRDNKRQRGESTSNSIDICLGEDDLRFKLMQKNTGRESQNSESPHKVDLRDKLLSKTSRPCTHGVTMRSLDPGGSVRHPVLDPRVAGMTRHPVRESRDASISSRFPPSRHPSEISAIPSSRHPSLTLRQRSPEVLRQSSPEDLRQRSPHILRQRSLEVLRQGSPERLLRPSAARGISPQRTREELQRRTLIRTYDDGRSVPYSRISPARAVRSSPYLNQPLVPAPVVNSTVPVSHYPQAGQILQRIPSSVDVPPTVDGLLKSLGLDKYAIYFKAEEVDMNALRQLGDSDLKDLGIPMGPRKKILQAVMPRARRQPLVLQ